jgi:hypothetical protein
MKQFFMFMLLLGVVFSSAFAGNKKTPSMLDDFNEVIQKVIDIPQFQTLYPQNQDGSFKPLQIMRHGVRFPSAISATHQNNRIVLIDKSVATSGQVAGYFLFNQFEVREDRAWVDGVYYFDQQSSAPKTEVFKLELEKQNGSWVITNSKIERRTL